MKKLIAVLVTALCFSVNPATSQGNKPIIIANDLGGEVSQYDQKFSQYQANGNQVVIKGICASACARYMKLKNVCADKNATFAFHAMYDPRTDIIDEKGSIADSLLTDTPKALALEYQYNTFQMGLSRTRPYAKKTVQQGVIIVYDEIYYKHQIMYQQFLLVRASLLIPLCVPHVAPGVNRTTHTATFNATTGIYASADTITGN